MPPRERIESLPRADLRSMSGRRPRAPQDDLGHKGIQHEVRYTELSPTKFKDFGVGFEPDLAVEIPHPCADYFLG